MNLRSLLARIVGDAKNTSGGTGPAVKVSSEPVEALPAEERPNLDENQLLIDAFDEAGTKGVMIDVGVHFGSTTTPFLDRGWQVIGFEPDKKKHGALKKLAEEQPRFELHTCAVGDAASEGMQFYTSQESTGIASLVPFRHTHEKGEVVPVRTLRDVLAESGTTEVDYLKIDAEGFDLRVLEGFPFDSISPTAIMCEFEDGKTQQIGYSTDDLGGYLLDKGYSVYMSEWHPIVRYGITHRWRSIRSYPCELSDPKGWGNFIAVKPGPFEEYFRRAMRPWA